MANSEGKKYYWESLDQNTTGENVGIVLDSLCDIVAENEIEENKDTVKWIPGEEGEKGHFELGEGGGGGIAQIQANHYEVIIGDGQGSAYGGSYDSAQKGIGSFYAENCGGIYDGDDTYSRATHYIYGLNQQGSSPTYERYVLGAKYLTTTEYGVTKQKLPNGCFMMVDYNSFMKAKNGSQLTLDMGQIRVSNNGNLIVNGNGGNSAFVSFERTSSDNKETSFVFHDSILNITNGVNVRIHDKATIDMDTSATVWMHNQSLLNIEGQAKITAYNNAQFYMDSNANLHMQGNGSWHPKIMCQGNAAFIMNGEAGLDNNGNPFGPLFILNKNGRVYTSKGNCDTNGGYATGFTNFMRPQGNAKALLKKAWYEYTRTGEITAETLDLIYNTRTEGRYYGGCWQDLSTGELNEVERNMYFYSVYSITNSMKGTLQSMIAYYNEQKSTSITMDLIYNPCAVVKPNLYFTVLNFDSSVLAFLTEEASRDVTANAFKTACDVNGGYSWEKYYTNFKTALENQHIDFNTYFTEEYPIFRSGNYYGFNLLTTIYNFYKEAYPSFPYTLDDFKPSFQYYLSKNEQSLRRVFTAANNGVDDTDSYVASKAQSTNEEIIFKMKTISSSKETQLLNVGKNINYYIDLTNRTIINTTDFQNLIKSISGTTAENIHEDSTIIINGEGYNWIQMASDEFKQVDVRFLDGGSVEFNGDARLVLTSKQLYEKGDFTLPVRYEPGLTISFDYDAQYHRKPTQDSITEIHFSPQDLYTLKYMIENGGTALPDATSQNF